MRFLPVICMLLVGFETLAKAQVTCVKDTENIYRPINENGVPLCREPLPLAIPTEGRIIDLSHYRAGDPGTCGSYFRSTQTVEIDPALGFPLFIKLPVVNQRDLDCAQFCELGESSPGYDKTNFGIAFALKNELNGHQRLIVRAPAPWYFVMGNEGFDTPCMDGRPTVLEFGKPLNCAVSYSARFGLATKDMAPAGGYVSVDVVPLENVTDSCCPYMCSTN